MTGFWCRRKTTATKKLIVKQGFLPLAMCESKMVPVLSEASLFCPTEIGAVEWNKTLHTAL